MPATTIWLHALATAPAPTSPISSTVPPITSSSGRSRSNIAGDEPHMIDMVPSTALATPPDMQASITST